MDNNTKHSRHLIHGYWPESAEERAKEFIRHEMFNHEFWICNCGNTPTAEGFQPCDDLGNKIEPVEPAWNGTSYVCDKCGRIIHQGTLEVVGRRVAP